MAFDRSGWKDKLMQRQEQSFKTKDDTGRFKSILKPLPDGYSIWKCNEGEHVIDSVFYLASEKNPNNVLVGDPTYNIDVWMHRKVGTNEDNYICLNKTFGKPCPICQHRTFLKESEGLDEKSEEGKAVLKPLNPTRRCIYNIWVHDNKEEEGKGVQIWDVSHYLFEVPLLNQSKIPKIEGVSVGGKINFTDPDTGKMISFTRKGKTEMSTEFVSFQFFDKAKPIPDEILQKAICLDELIYIPTYDEVYSAFHSGKIPQEEEVDEKYELEQQAHLDSLKQEKDIPDFAPPKQEEDPREARRQARLAARTQPAEPANECPHGHKFGADIDVYDECAECAKVDDCEKRADEITLQKEQQLRTEVKKEEPKRPLSRRPGK